MRIIEEAFLVTAGRDHSPAARHLAAWRKIVKTTAWRNLLDVRRTYPDTDTVKVRSGREVLVFNLRGNEYRLMVAAHFDRQIIYPLRLMTDAEYSKNRWKDTV